MEVIDILQNRLDENKLWYNEYIRIRDDYEQKANKIMKEIKKLEKKLNVIKNMKNMG